MLRLLSVVVLCAAGLTACGMDSPQVDESAEVLGSSEQGLACEYDTGACPSGTTCAWFSDNPDEGLCRPPCINGTCSSPSQVCCTQRNGAPYCNWSCL